jgi:AmmeMemoRadiSam system protein B/AmmeMemoRadiSam system protein A
MLRRIKPKFLLLAFSFCTTGIAVTKKFHLDANWYPPTKKELNALIKTMENNARTHYQAFVPNSSLRAIIVPHAAYIHSGTVATAVFSLLRGAPIQRVIILAPDHAGIIQDIGIPTFTAYRIPNGTVPVDRRALKKLTKSSFFKPHDEVFAREHSLEIELPLIRYYLKNAKIVPLFIGHINCVQAQNIAQTLQEIIDENTLVIVSSDFVHYGKAFSFTPFSDYQQLRTRALDSQAINLIDQALCPPFEQFMQSSRATICGAAPLKILLSLLELKAFGPVEPRLIAYDTSGKRDVDDSVSYVGMLFTTQKLMSLPIKHQLTQQEQRNIRQQAIDILTHLFDQTIDKTLYDPIKSFGVMHEQSAFVTLRKKTKKSLELRGCIGRLSPHQPLYKTVAEITHDAALRDIRFPPVTVDEIPSLKLEVSVLSPAKRINNYRSIQLGTDGIILEEDMQSALFLPDVPLEFKWDLPTMLTQLAQKAGLPKTAWQDKKTVLKTFTTLTID